MNLSTAATRPATPRRLSRYPAQPASARQTRLTSLAIAEAAPGVWLRDQYRSRESTRILGPRWERNLDRDRESIILRIVGRAVRTSPAAGEQSSPRIAVCRESVAAVVAEVLGAELAAHVRVATVKRRRELLLRVAHTIYIMEARRHLPTLLAKLKPLGITSVRFTHYE